MSSIKLVSGRSKALLVALLAVPVACAVALPFAAYKYGYEKGTEEAFDFVHEFCYSGMRVVPDKDKKTYIMCGPVAIQQQQQEKPVDRNDRI